MTIAFTLETVELLMLHRVAYFGFFQQHISLGDLKTFKRWEIYFLPDLKGLIHLNIIINFQFDMTTTFNIISKSDYNKYI